MPDPSPHCPLQSGWAKRRSRPAALAACALALASAGASAGPRSKPPEAVDWRTPAEISDYRTTPRYAETMAYARRLVAAAPGVLRLETFGRTEEGRDLVVVIASKNGVFDPAALHRAGRPVVLVQNSIHAGEMDGKDACLALLRDVAITRQRAALLDNAVLVVIPIYNADGHERFGPFNRINQNGPEETGWRTQSRNLNLNRDYMKADTPETRAFLRLWNSWLPDLFVDTHVTDGADFQYDTTYGIDTGPDVFPALAEWKRAALAPYIETSVAAAGHVVAAYLNFKDDLDPSQGLTIAQDVPRFSTGYVNLQNRPALLLETHMLKDYRTRVLGSYEFVRAVLEVVNRDAGRLVAMNREADAATIAAGRQFDAAARFPLRVEADGTTAPFVFRGYRSTMSQSEISGGRRIEYSRELIEMTVPRQTSLRVSVAVAPPLAYIVPVQWTPVIDVLEAHGLRMEKTARPWEGEVDTYRCDGVRWFEHPFEGRQVLFSSGEAPLASLRGPLRRRAREAGVPGRLGRGAPRSARRPGGDPLAGAPGARLGRGVGLLQRHLRAEGVRRVVRDGEGGPRHAGQGSPAEGGVRAPPGGGQGVRRQPRVAARLLLPALALVGRAPRSLPGRPAHFT